MEDPLLPSKNHLLDLINSLYARRDHIQISRELLTSLQVFVPFDAAALLPIDRRRFEIGEGIFSGNDAALIEEYAETLAATDPCSLSARCPTRLNQTASLSKLLDSGDWDPRDVADAQAAHKFEDAISVVAGWRSQPIALLRLHRRPGTRRFSGPEIELINGIAPHIAMSLVLNKSGDMQSLGAETGLLALAGDGEPLYSNEAARYILSQLPASSIRALAHSKSVWRSNDSAGVFRLRILSLTSRSLLSWLSREQLKRLSGRATRSELDLTVVAVEPIQRRHALANRLVHSRLSRREVEVALCVMRGMSNADIASELRIDEKTVKDHLRRIYGKIDVRSRTAMISKVLGLEAELIPSAELNAKSTL